MYNVGQTLTFSATATGTGLVYVWSWWDGTTSVTSTPSVEKKINRSGTLAWSVKAVDPLGRSSTQSSTVVVYTPPKFASVSLTRSTGVFPYNTLLSALVVSANSGSVYFNGTSRHVLSGTGSVSIQAHIPAVTTILLSGTDSTTMASSSLPLSFIGRAPSVPRATAPVVAPAVWRIGTGLTGELSASASSADGGPVTFSWIFTTTGGWSSNSTQYGTTTQSGGGGYSNVLVVQTSGETAGTKQVTLRVTSLNGQQLDQVVSVELVENSQPEISGITTYPSTTVSSGSTVIYSGTASDPDSDRLYYLWTFTGAVSGGSLTRSDAYTGIEAVGTGVISSTLVVYDGVGGTDSMAGPAVTAV